tara:strand:- start:28444 stop:28767 length:324 start_codon:yes stop_codon:yes gene_type:complete
MEYTMNKNRLLIATLSSFVLLTTGAAFAADSSPAKHPTEMHKKMEDKMSCEGMKGMMGKGMMNKGQMMPDLPSGNEKLNAQMHAEMMQSMGNIMEKYAEKIPNTEKN